MLEPKQPLFLVTHRRTAFAWNVGMRSWRISLACGASYPIFGFWHLGFLMFWHLLVSFISLVIFFSLLSLSFAEKWGSRLCGGSSQPAPSHSEIGDLLTYSDRQKTVFTRSGPSRTCAGAINTCLNFYIFRRLSEIITLCGTYVVLSG